ncbi:pentatricopeptide repeat-containing protein At5g48910-like [Telopea speciosissima]|uniref:pentatricopeptide repeat-containing protein At5g48910-like n=1 Tax=Telopea speciosissima TaxID=54955 RepID=UPI001CC799C0|nr:pentatricopeptide repeat-containing protein At5g48910-like [Telopea speciosissima]
MILKSTLPWISSLSSFPPLPTALSLLNGCKSTREIQQLHALAVKTGFFYYEPLVASRIVESCCSIFHYSSPKSEDVNYALSVFDQTHYSSTFVYNTLIRAQTQVDQSEEALLLFYWMLCDPSPIVPDKFTFPFVLKSCAQLGSIEEGEQIHSLVLKTNFVSDEFVLNSIIHMYGRCGKINSAQRVFEGMSERNIVTWNSMIDGLVKSGDLGSAYRLFYEMPQRNLVSWNTMIAGYARHSFPYEALDLLVELKVTEISPDESTLVSAISAISDLGLLRLGKLVHGYVIRHEFALTSALGASLVDMYSKCGSIYGALRVFMGILNKNVGHWTSLIVGFAVHGLAEDALKLFSQMLSSGVKPNYVTFIGVLSACSHGGLVKVGLENFNLMRRTYNIEPTIQHYGCIVDLLGRSGLLREAKELIENMPIRPGPVLWGSLLSACRNHRNIEIGEIAAQNLVEVMPDFGGGYVLLSNLYAGIGRWEDFGRARRVMADRGVKKVPGLSWIEVDGEIHEFVAGDKFHPRSVDIYNVLVDLDSKLRWVEL